MPIVCPAILASEEIEYKVQIEKIVHVASRIQIDLTDGIFATNKTITPDQAWWPVGFKADFHLMYKDPMQVVGQILKHQPNMIIVHAEAQGDFVALANLCKQHQVKVGIALLSDTPAEKIIPALQFADHALIFSGHLGEFGGSANLDLLDKVSVLKQNKPSLEIGWDGGVDDQNTSSLVAGGVDVLNVGGYLQHAEVPEHAFEALQRIADETGST